MIQFTAVESIFFAALEKPAGPGRAAFLSQACGTDADLRGHMKHMLAAHPQAGSFLNAPAQSRSPPSTNRRSPNGPVRSWPYKLLEQIGEAAWASSTWPSSSSLSAARSPSRSSSRHGQPAGRRPLRGRTPGPGADGSPEHRQGPRCRRTTEQRPPYSSWSWSTALPSPSTVTTTI